MWKKWQGEPYPFITDEALTFPPFLAQEPYDLDDLRAQGPNFGL